MEKSRTEMWPQFRRAERHLSLEIGKTPPFYLRIANAEGGKNDVNNIFKI